MIKGRKYLWLLLVMAICVSLLTVSASAATSDSGTCGANLTWTLTSSGKLTVSGTGAMTDFSADGAPWHGQKTAITKIVISSGVTSIGSNAFSGCSAAASLSLPSTVTKIGNNAFSWCSSLKTVSLPSKLKTIGDEAFWGCKGLTKVTIPGAVTSVGSYAFAFCDNLASVVIPKGTTSFGGGTFSNCPKLETVGPAGGDYDIQINWTTSIPQKAFSTCGDILSVTIPSGVTTIAANAFENCGDLTSVDIPDSVTSIGDFAFASCTDLTDVVVPSGVSEMERGAFMFCNGLTEFKLPTALKEIAYDLFTGCKNLTKITIPGNVTVIDMGAFADCSEMESVTIPLSVKTIREGAFSSCDNLTDVYFKGSPSQWNAISIASGNDALEDAVFHWTLAKPVVTATNRASDGKPMLTWKAVDGAAKYHVYRSTSKNGTYSWMYSTTGTSYANTLAEPGGLYYYKVYAVDAAGTWSKASDIVYRTCDCARPVVTATNRASDGKPMLTWNAVDGAVKYEVYRSTSKNGTYSWMYTTTGTSYVNTLAESGGLYYYKVIAIGPSSAANSAYSAVTYRTCDYPRPTGLTSTNVSSSGRVKLTWNAVEGATKYEIWRSTSKNGSYTRMYTTTGTSYTNTNATPGTLYYYKIRAIGSVDAAASAYSAVTYRTCDCAQPVVTATNRASDGKPMLTWNAVDGAVKYEVYRSTSRNGTYSWTYTTTDTSYVNTLAEAGKTYYYKVIAIGSSSAANSAFSAVDYRTCDYAAPAVTASNRASDGKPTLSWSAVPGATKYEVYRSTSYNGTYSWMHTTTGTSYVNVTAEPGVCYYYKVRAFGSVSAAASAYSTVDERTCDYAAPVVTVSVQDGTGKPVLTWKEVAGATKYEVYRSTSKNGTYSWTYSTAGTRYVNTLAESGNTYYYKVRAFGSASAAASAYSSVVSATCK